MNGQAGATPYVEQLRDELVRAATRQHRARRRRRALFASGAGVVGLAGLVALLVGLLVSPSEQPASAEGTVRVTRNEAETLVEIVDIDRPDEVVADLRAVGLDVARAEQTTGPSRVGTVVGFSVEGDTRQTPDTDAFYSAYVIGRAGVTITVGVETPAGAAYDAATDALAEGEALHCLSWLGQSTAELAAVAQANDIDLLVIDAEDGPVDELPAGAVVVGATALSIDRVQVRVGDGPAADRPVGCGAPPTAG
jgi:hypothetical protein